MYSKRLFAKKRGSVYNTNLTNKRQKVDVDEELQKIKNNGRFHGTDNVEDTRKGGAVQFERA